MKKYDVLLWTSPHLNMVFHVQVFLLLIIAAHVQMYASLYLSTPLNVFAFIKQGDHWSGKSQGNLIFLQGQGKVRKFCKLVREILDPKKVREKSGNFISWAQNYLGCSTLSV